MKKPFEVKDHSVSGKTFSLRYDAQSHMYFTEPKPSEAELPSYYESKDYISHTDGTRSFFEKVYQGVKQIALSRKHNLLKKHVPTQGTVLDIGAGTGDFLEFLSKKGWNIQGVEPSEQARSLAAKKAIVLEKELPRDTSPFDAITMWHVLEHVYELEAQWSWLKTHLAMDGTLFIAVPNFESHDANVYSAHWAAYDVPRHLYHFSKKAIKRLAQENQLEVVAVHPMKFDAYYVSLLSEKYKKGRMRFVQAFWNGWISNFKARRSGAYSSLIYVIKHQKN
ncbi:MAG: 2-polyprenyl-3-methyl-5-hydroxy-6-metoxy-1,4-benzoquinol methylase [Flavobacteriales bacterium]|jgi:2-polyprenyl-3-methyl-5-hydroxy-6-metoxy-1,4-benzoquinol methylase